MPVFKIDIVKSGGGIGAHETYRNEYFINSPHPIDSNGVAANIAQIIDAEATQLLATQTIIRSHIVQLANLDKDQKGQPSQSTEVNVIGHRPAPAFVMAGGVPVAANPGLPLEICLVLKRNVLGGRGGRVSYRGMLKKDEIDTSVNGRWFIIDPAPILAGIITKLNTNLEDAQFVMRGPANHRVSGALVFNNFVLKGVAMIQLGHTVQSTEAERRDVVRRNLLKAYKRVKRILGDLDPATMTPTQKAIYDAAKLIVTNEWLTLPAAEQLILRVLPIVAEILLYFGL